MAIQSIAELASVLGISVNFLVLLIFIGIWDAIWKIVALWKSARNKQLAWFILLAIINSVGILPIVYLLIYRERKGKAVKPTKKK